MKKALAVALMGALFAGFAMAQPYFIEVDLDGIAGNGPDAAAANVSDYIDVNIWVSGSGPGLLSSNFTICNLDGSLEFQGYTNLVPAPWTPTPPQDLGNGDGDDGQVVPAQANRRPTQNQSEERSSNHGGDGPGDDGPRTASGAGSPQLMGDQEHERVGADEHETDLTEVE